MSGPPAPFEKINIYVRGKLFGTTRNSTSVVRNPKLHKMDTGEFARFLKLTLKIARYLATSPYTWSDEDKVEFSGRRSLRYFAFVAQMTLYLTYESFVMSRWVQISYFDPKATNKEKTAVQYVAFSYGIPVMLHLCSFFNADQLHLLINRMLLYQRGTMSSKITT